jgi:hypothetical protein
MHKFDSTETAFADGFLLFSLHRLSLSDDITNFYLQRIIHFLEKIAFFLDGKFVCLEFKKLKFEILARGGV